METLGDILHFKQRLSHSKIGLLEEHTTYNRSSKMNYFIYTSHHTRVKQAAPGREGGGGGGYLSLSLLPSFLRKLLTSLISTQNGWAPNDRMFPNTPEVSQMVFSVL